MPRRTAALLAAALCGLALATPGPARALGDRDYVGSIELVGFTYCPQGTIPLHGQLLPTDDFPLLFSVLGNRYGGDGAKGTFAVPDYREIEDGRYVDRAPVPGMRYCLVTDGDYPVRP